MPKFRQMPKLRRLVSELTRSHCRSSRLARGLRLQRAMQTKPSIVFVHGIWADGSSFSKVIPTLRAEGRTDDRVAGLVYVAALAPDAGETSQSQQDQFATTDIFSHIEIAERRVWMLLQGVACFAGDCPTGSRSSSGRLSSRRPRTCSTRSLMAPPGGRSRAGTSWPTTTVR